MSVLERLHASAADRPFAVDAAATVVLVLLVVPLSVPLTWGFTPFGRPATALWALLLVAPLAWRRARPVASAATIYAVGLAQLVAGPALVLPADAAVLVALYSVTVHGPRWAGRVAMGAVAAGALAFTVRVAGEVGLAQAARTGVPSSIVMVIAGLATWAFALLRRARQATYDALRDRAARLELERDQQARLATAAERSRIAREMHDVVAHSLSVVIAQADGGRYAAEQEPAAALRALDTIGATGRAALADMRRILGILRTDPTEAPLPTGPGGGTPEARTSAPAPDLAPQPGAADLEALVAQVRDAGLRVSLVRVGTPRLLPAGLGLAAYRICQEAMTNVLKHAGPDPSVTVLQQWLPSSLVLEVADDGRGAAADTDGDGHGLLGMRERVALFGGTLQVGPRPGGGFRVRATLPLALDPDLHDPVVRDPAPSQPEPPPHDPSPHDPEPTP